MIRFGVIDGSFAFVLLSTVLFSSSPACGSNLNFKQTIVAQNDGRKIEKSKYQLTAGMNVNRGSGYHLGGTAYQVENLSTGASPVEGLDAQYVFDTTEFMKLACPENDDDKEVTGELTLTDWKSSFIAGQLALKNHDGPEAKKMFSLAETLIDDTDALAVYKKLLCHLRLAQANFEVEKSQLALEEIEKARGYFSSNKHNTATLWHSLAELASTAEQAKLYSVAEPLWQRCVETSLAMHMPTSIYVISTETRLANNLYYQREFRKAQQLYVRDLHVMSFLIPEYGAAALRNLLNVWKQTGHEAEAQQVEQKLRTIDTANPDREGESFLAILKTLPAGRQKARLDEDYVSYLYCEFSENANKLQGKEKDWEECKNQFQAAIRLMKFEGCPQPDYAWTLVAYGSFEASRHSSDASTILQEALSKPNVANLSAKQIADCKALLAVAKSTKQKH